MKNKKLENPRKITMIIKILVKNVLFSIAKISKKLYPDADVDYYDKTLVNTSTISSKFNSISDLLK